MTIKPTPYDVDAAAEVCDMIAGDADALDFEQAVEFMDALERLRSRAKVAIDMIGEAVEMMAEMVRDVYLSESTQAKVTALAKLDLDPDDYRERLRRGRKVRIIDSAEGG
jgi:hypothetical protein